MLKEHERRIGAVSDCLSEKAEENIQLYEEKVSPHLLFFLLESFQ